MIDLKKLSEAQSGEIAKMEQSIRGKAEGMLWTTSLRAAIRGGKCKVGIAADENHED